MICFDIEAKWVREGLPIERHPNGRAYVPVGEPGRGRRLIPVAVVGIDSNADRLYTASVGKDDRGRWILLAKDDGRRDRAIVRLWPRHGKRGAGWIDGPRMGFRCELHPGSWENESPIEVVYPSWKYDLDDGYLQCECGEEKEVYRAPIDIRIKRLATGTKADGAAGRVASSSQMLVILPKGVPVAMLRCGRLYGAPDRYIVWYDGQVVRSVSPYKLAQAPTPPPGFDFEYQHPFCKYIKWVLERKDALPEKKRRFVLHRLCLIPLHKPPVAKLESYFRSWILSEFEKAGIQ